MSERDKNIKEQGVNKEAQNDINFAEPHINGENTPDTEGQGQDDKEHSNEEISEIDELKQKLTTTRDELEKEKREYLFLMAEFDNYRKRVVKEKADLIKNASENVLAEVLPIVDDFERGLIATKNTENSSSVYQGMEIIYNKLIKYLKDNGVVEMETKGLVFDPDIHEAIAMVPAEALEDKGKIIDTVQKGYMLNDKVLRHAKVAVAQ